MKKTTRSSALILAGDIGGTKTRLGLYRVSETASRLLTSTSYPSKAYRGLASIIDEFLQRQERISAASFGVAGPVVNGSAVATNLPWKISESSLRRVLNIKNISLINDLVANAYGIEIMKKSDFSVLNRGRKSADNRQSCPQAPASARRSCSGPVTGISHLLPRAGTWNSARGTGWSSASFGISSNASVT